MEALALVPEAPDPDALAGFGLVGHLSEMATASGVGGRVAAGSLPLLRRELAGRGVPHWEIGRLTEGPAGRIVVTA
jgi:hypothetical protein